MIKKYLLLFVYLVLPLYGFIPKNAKIYIAGHHGLAGAAILKELEQQGFINIIMRTSQELDLRDRTNVYAFFAQEHPEYVFLAAGKVGGIFANMQSPADFIYDNLSIAINVIEAAHRYKVKKLLYLASSCVYPRLSAQPMKEEYLLTGLCEPTNEFYALAKIAGIKLCQAFNQQYGTCFISCLPCNLYGEGDHFNSEKSHVISALITKIAAAKKAMSDHLIISGTGKARREFLYVSDLAKACVFLMEHYKDNDIINVGSGTDISIYDLAYKIKEIIGYDGALIFDSSKPDGMPQKLLDVSKINALGWHASITLDEGLQRTVNWYYASLIQ